MAIKSSLFNIMSAAVEKAAWGLRRDFGEIENLQASVKGVDIFVSNSVHRAQEILVEMLQEGRAGYPLLTERQGLIEGHDKTHRWIITPLSGAVNFAHGIPHFAISVALEREGVLVAGLIYDPVSDARYFAERGNGAWYNDRARLRVAQRKGLADAVFAYIAADDVDRGRLMKEIDILSPRLGGLRCFGAPALDIAYLAAGRVDGFWGRGLGAWDIAAGIVLLREAGGLVSDMANRDRALSSGEVVAGNGFFHDKIIELIG